METSNTSEQKTSEQNNKPEEKATTSVEKNSVMAAIAYVGPLVLVSYVIAKDDPFVKFHIKQGFVLFTFEVALWVIGTILWLLMPLVNLLQLAALILSIVGIVNAVSGKEKELPFVGKYSSHFKI